MKKKIKIKSILNFSYDAPTTLTFAFLSLFLYFLSSVILKQKVDLNFLTSPAKNNSVLAFEAKNLMSYIRLFLYAFGGTSWASLFANLVFILLLGPSIEENYGSIIIGIMMFVSALFSGVLNACFCNQSLQGPISIIFMLIFLNAFISFSKKKIPLSFFVVFILFTLFLSFTYKEADDTLKFSGILVNIIINIAGGLCGSLFAFLASPKGRSNRKSVSEKASPKKVKTKTEVLSEFDDENSPRFKKDKKDNEDDGSTVIGTIKF